MLFAALKPFSKNLTPLTLPEVKYFNALSDAWSLKSVRKRYEGPETFPCRAALFTWALRWLRPSTTVIYIALNPLTALLSGALLVGEAVQPAMPLA